MGWGSCRQEPWNDERDGGSSQVTWILIKCFIGNFVLEQRPMIPLILPVGQLMFRHYIDNRSKSSLPKWPQLNPFGSHPTTSPCGLRCHWLKPMNPSPSPFDHVSLPTSNQPSPSSLSPQPTTAESSWDTRERDWETYERNYRFLTVLNLFQSKDLEIKSYNRYIRLWKVVSHCQRWIICEFDRWHPLCRCGCWRCHLVDCFLLLLRG